MASNVYKSYLLKMDKSIYTYLREIQSRVLINGKDLTLNEIIEGCIRIIQRKELNEEDMSLFQRKIDLVPQET